MKLNAISLLFSARIPLFANPIFAHSKIFKIPPRIIVSLLVVLGYTLAITHQTWAHNARADVKTDLGRNTDFTAAKWPTCDNALTAQTISFVHVSDLHAHYNPATNGSSPLTRIKGYYKQVREENPYTLFTNAGDDYEKGSLAEQLSHGQSTREVVQAMEFDVRTLGNHDFAWGLDELLRFSHDPTGSVVTSNALLDEGITGSEDKIPGWVDFTVRTVGCVKIGFFGLVTKPWDETGKQYDGLYYSDQPTLHTDFRYTEIARKIIAKHRHEVDLLVLVSHLGLTDDIALAEQTDGIDLILGGHTHTILTKPIQINSTTIIHAGSNGNQIGRLDLEYDLREKHINDTRFSLINNREGEVPTDPELEGKVATILAPYKRQLFEQVAVLSANQTPRTMTQIAARAAVTALGADAALVSHNSVWQIWKQGGLTRQDILDGFAIERQPSGTPGLSSFYLIEVTGQDLFDAAISAKEFSYWGPTTIEPTGRYTLALQKSQAFQQILHFGKTIGISIPKPAEELWKIVAAFGQGQNNLGLALDEGLPKTNKNKLIALLQENLSPLSKTITEKL